MIVQKLRLSLAPLGLFLCGQALAQLPLPASLNEPITIKVERLAVSSKAGNLQATTDLTRQLFTNAAIPIDLADSLGFTDRIVKAETDYRRGEHALVSEAAIVKAINNMVSTIGAPTWANTSTQEVRKLRMHLLVNYPQFFASHEAPDASGRYKAVMEKMTPLEASYIAISLLYQKTSNPEYLFSDTEKAANASANSATLKVIHTARLTAVQNLLQGKTQALSVRDLLGASDHLFSDLGIEPVPASGVIALLSKRSRQGSQR